MLNITKQSDYCMLLLSLLKNKKEFVPLSRLLKDIDLPKRFLARIAAELVQTKILDSREGKVGGYRISKLAVKLSLYDYLKIFEGDLALTKCTKPGYDCPWNKYCRHKSVFRHSLNEILSQDLKKYKLLQVV